MDGTHYERLPKMYHVNTNLDLFKHFCLSEETLELFLVNIHRKLICLSIKHEQSVQIMFIIISQLTFVKLNFNMTKFQDLEAF